MSDVAFLEPSFWLLYVLARSMRARDVAEVEALGQTPLSALEDSVRRSEVAFVMLIGGTPAAAFGVARGYREPPAVWCLTGEAVERHRVTFWRWSKHVVATLLAEYPCLVAHTDARYASALAWLGRLGARVYAAVPVGADAVPFHPVVLGRL